jgi:hypothetical protein
MRLRAIAVAVSCLGMTGTGACSCHAELSNIYVAPFNPYLYVGESVKTTAFANGVSDYCPESSEDSDHVPGAYTFSTKDSSVAIVSSRGQVTGVGPGKTSLTVKRGFELTGGALIWVSRPVAFIRISTTPASPAVGDTVDAITEAIDLGGIVTPGAHFTGLTLDPIPDAGGANPVLLPTSRTEDHIRFVIKSPGRYVLLNTAVHLADTFPARVDIKVP